MAAGARLLSAVELAVSSFLHANAVLAEGYHRAFLTGEGEWQGEVLERGKQGSAAVYCYTGRTLI